tara:strand:+ start:3755 stop:3931 length:177 start_codon:yes stop_codon:yes gene_type:complete
MDTMMSVCCLAAAVGGLHMVMTESQPVLGIDAFDFPFVQKAVGVVLFVCGAGCLFRGN